jgi:hypothetical protein
MLQRSIDRAPRGAARLARFALGVLVVAACDAGSGGVARNASAEPARSSPPINPFDTAVLARCEAAARSLEDARASAAARRR